MSGLNDITHFRDISALTGERGDGEGGEVGKLNFQQLTLASDGLPVITLIYVPIGWCTQEEKKGQMHSLNWLHCNIHSW